MCMQILWFMFVQAIILGIHVCASSSLALFAHANSLMLVQTSSMYFNASLYMQVLVLL